MLREEYPRPEFVRDNWQNLNGEWEFEPDYAKTGKARGVIKKQKLDGKITVPFCPESKLSGVENKDFLNAVWYRRTVDINAAGGRVLLNFEASYYRTEAFVNGESTGVHEGGYTPFSFDITRLVKKGENQICVYVEGDPRDLHQPSGKQSVVYASRGCHYTRSTGIWQTVWLEYISQTYLKRVKLDGDTDNSLLTAQMFFDGEPADKTVKLTAKFGGKVVGGKAVLCSASSLFVQIELSELHLWDIGSPALYDLEIEVVSAGGTDCVKTYFGMRKIQMDGAGLCINGRRVFQRLVLDQGYYPDGIYTAPDEKDLLKDIKIAMALGYNGARLHEKVFERRFLYYADKEGYLCWGEYPNWGYDHSAEWATDIYLKEWMEAVERDYNHPSIIGWCPLNETWTQNGREQNDKFLETMYNETKRFDPARPVIDSSGSKHIKTDIFDHHSYEQDIGVFREKFGDFGEGYGHGYNGQSNDKALPYFLSEYGGASMASAGTGWGYGNSPADEEEFKKRYCSFAEALLNNPKVCALCYTQLYDVEQEQNGIYTYARKPKFSQNTMKEMTAAMKKNAVIEKADGNKNVT